MTGDCTPRGSTPRPQTGTCATSASRATGSCGRSSYSGGRSNLTFLVYDDASKWVLRRPPLHGGSTHRPMTWPGNTGWSPRAGGYPGAGGTAVTMRDDDSVLGAPFQMVEYVPGQVVRTRADLEALGGPEVVSDCVDGLIKVLVDLHQVDPDAVGLGDFGKPTGYLERQVRRWGSAVGLRPVAPRPAGRRCGGCTPSSRKPSPGGEPRLDRARRLPHRQHHADADDPRIVRAVLDCWRCRRSGDRSSRMSR